MHLGEIMLFDELSISAFHFSLYTLDGNSMIVSNEIHNL